MLSSLLSSSNVLLDRGSARMLQAANESADLDTAVDAVMNAKLAKMETQLGVALARMADDSLASTLDLLA